MKNDLTVPQTLALLALIILIVYWFYGSFLISATAALAEGRHLTTGVSGATGRMVTLSYNPSAVRPDDATLRAAVDGAPACVYMEWNESCQCCEHAMMWQDYLEGAGIRCGIAMTGNHAMPAVEMSGGEIVYIDYCGNGVRTFWPTDPCYNYYRVAVKTIAW